jgi:hypothetical protein
MLGQHNPNYRHSVNRASLVPRPEYDHTRPKNYIAPIGPGFLFSVKCITGPPPLLLISTSSLRMSTHQIRAYHLDLSTPVHRSKSKHMSSMLYGSKTSVHRGQASIFSGALSIRRPAASPWAFLMMRGPRGGELANRFQGQGRSVRIGWVVHKGQRGLRPLDMLQELVRGPIRSRQEGKLVAPQQERRIGRSGRPQKG